VNFEHGAEDVGSRVNHYRDLVAIWQEQVDKINDQVSIGPYDKSQLEKFEAAIKLADIEIDSLTDHNSERWKLKSRVNECSAEIAGGRGTPLKTADQYRDMG
jgi:hypothetical protein